MGPRTGRVADPGDGETAVSTGEPLLLDRVATSGFAGDVAKALLAGVLVADHLDQARELLERHPDRRVVTLAGELLAAGRVEGGVVPVASGLAARRAADRAPHGVRGGGLVRTLFAFTIVLVFALLAYAFVVGALAR